MTKLNKYLLITSVVIILSAFLPWASTPLGSLAGISGDGIFTLLFGIINALVVFFIGKKNTEKSIKTVKSTSIILGSLVFLIGLYPIVSVGAFIGIGLYLTVLGGISTMILPFIKKL